MRPWFPLLAGAVVYLAALLWAGTELPADGVPVHFDASGTPTRFATRGEFLTTGTLFGVIMIVIGAAAYLLAVRGPLRLISIPHKAHWTRPERVPRLRRMLGQDMGRTFGAALVFLTFVPVSTVHASRARPPGLPAGTAWIVAGVLVVALTAWCVWLARYRYRPS